jgi:uncharacterized membrane-anchored protein
MRKSTWIVWGVLLVALGAVNVSIARKEKLLADGRVVLLQLAPVDPRSLMQGDYMALDFAVAREIRSASKERAVADGRVAVKPDEQGVGRFVRLLAAGETPAAGEVALVYRIRDGRVKFATNAWFFQEGQAAVYERARYGEFRASRDGELLLTGMRGEKLEPLGAR